MVSGAGTLRAPKITLDLDTLLKIQDSRHREILIPEDLLRKWDLPVLTLGENTRTVPAAAIRLRLVRKIGRTFDGTGVHTWELVAFPFTRTSAKRMLAKKVTLKPTDGKQVELQAAFEGLAEKLSMLDPPVGATVDIYFCHDRSHQVLLEPRASSALLAQRQRAESIKHNDAQWDRWWTWGRRFLYWGSRESARKAGEGPTNLRKIHPPVRERWSEEGDQVTAVAQIIRDHELLFSIVWRSLYWDEAKPQLVDEGWYPNPKRVTIMSGDRRMEQALSARGFKTLEEMGTPATMRAFLAHWAAGEE